MNTHAGAAEIERDIRLTRARMDSTIDALKMKLSPGEFLDQTLGYLREGGAEVGQSFARRVRANPLPLTLMAASIVWLIASERRPGWRSGEDREDWSSDAFEAGRPRQFERRYPRAYTEAPYRASEDDFRFNFGAEDHEAIESHDRVHRAMAAVKRRADETAEAFNDRLYEAKAGALDLRRDTSEALETFSARVDDAFHRLSGRAADARRKIKEGAARLAGGAGRATKDAAASVKHGAERAGRYYEEHPLAVGALGVAVGALLGSALPSTRAEDRRLGAAGDAVRRRSAAYAREAASAVGDVADRVRDAAEHEGLTSGRAETAARDVAERVRRVGEEAVEAGREEAERRLPRE